jgi:hypothetical protein
MILEAVLVKTSLFLVPSLTLEFPVGDYYFKQMTMADCKPKELTRWGPKIVTWDVEAGYKKDGYTFFVGHRSRHDIGQSETQKSYDYVGVSYKKEFK